MSIASGFTKMKNYILTSSGYKLLSRWTSSQTVHMGDGTDDTDTVEYRFGAMKGITSSLATDNDEFALSASAGKNLQDQCTQLNQSLTNKNIATVICRPNTTIYDNDSQDLYTEFTCEQNPNDFNLFTAIVSAAYMQTPVYIKEWYSETEDGINISASRTIPVDKHYYNYYYTIITWERNQTAPYKIKVRRAREFFITSTDGVSVEKIGFNGNLHIHSLQGIK